MKVEAKLEVKVILVFMLAGFDSEFDVSDKFGTHPLELSKPDRILLKSGRSKNHVTFNLRELLSDRVNNMRNIYIKHCKARSPRSLSRSRIHYRHIQRTPGPKETKSYRLLLLYCASVAYACQ